MRNVHLNNETCTNGSVVRVWCGSQSVVCSLSGDQTLFYTTDNNSTHTTDVQSDVTYNPWLGLTLALLSAFLIGGSVILKKKALLRLASNGHTRAGDGGHGYLKDWLWWGGLLTSKSLMCHLCDWSTITFIYVCRDISFICVHYTNVFVLRWSHCFFNQTVLSQRVINQLMNRTLKLICVFLCLVLYDISVLASPLIWILLVTLIVSIVTQVNYLNKSLDTFNTLLVYPIYYVLFTTVVLSTSIILFQEWRSMAAVDVVTTLGAFLVIVVGVSMLHLFRELQLTMKQLTSQLSQPVEREGLADEVSANERPAAGGGGGGGGGSRSKKEDKYGLMDNMVIESLPPMREEGPRVFIIS
ncbi:magnesium transporter NIPA4-like [Epinephelus moara]|uniref:magnesium transporter NIPA4-like n=1 Tax=Epinephelus moara TaxID=300413 RepID=UPI00214F377C|nr:magnesium transporter NIPA4-like [Epinephelus moara]